MLRAALLLGLAWLFSAPLPAQAAPAPIVFDFEDGLQGWTLGGSAQRVETDILGGQWAISGTLGASVEFDIDSLPRIALFSFDWFFAGDAEVGFLSIRLTRFSQRGIAVTSLVESTELNPRLVGPLGFFPPVDLVQFDLFRIGWFEDPFGSSVPVGTSPESFISFIDNITFHPVPEPSSWLLLSLGIAGVVMIRRKRASRA